MAKNETRRLSPALAQEDKDAYAALQKVVGYAPNNPDYELAKVKTAFDTSEAANQSEVQADAAADAARDNTVAKEWAFHNVILGVKKQVAGQFGDSSDELQSLGLKKKTEYKTPQRNGKTTPTPTPVPVS